MQDRNPQITDATEAVPNRPTELDASKSEPAVSSRRREIERVRMALVNGLSAPVAGMLLVVILILGTLLASGLLAPFAALLSLALAGSAMYAGYRARPSRPPPATTEVVPLPLPLPLPLAAMAAPVLPTVEVLPVQPSRTERTAPVVRALLQALPDAVLVTDSTGQVLFMNDRMGALFPKAREGLPVSQVSRSPEFLDAVDQAIERGRITVDLEERVPVRRRLTAIIVAFWKADLVGDAAILITFRDMSEMERLAQMRADFIANASHELRTPLASLKGFVETLQGPARDDAAARDRFLAIMATQASRMTRLIDDLLSLSRVEMRAHLPLSGTVDPGSIASFVVQAMEPVATEADVAIEFFPLDRPAVVRGDREELVQVLQNLVHNAIKYGQPGRQIEIRMSRRPATVAGRGFVAIAITDHGPGIAAEHLPRLTERFYRVNAMVSRDKGGTGLGLAIVKNILNRHRGELEISSELGYGSTFTVVLPEMNG